MPFMMPPERILKSTKIAVKVKHQGQNNQNLVTSSRHHNIYTRNRLDQFLIGSYCADTQTAYTVLKL